MRELKVQCDCGQKFKFDVEPVNDQMPFTVNCPVCGKDGTEKANLILRAQAGVRVAVPVAAPLPPAPAPMDPAIAAAAAPTSVASLVPSVPVAAQSSLRINTAARAEPPIVAPAPMAAPQRAPISFKPSKSGNDGWDKPESDFNKKGSYVVLIPAIAGAMISSGYIPIEIPVMFIWIAVGVSGLAGGFINIYGRGPIICGMIVGLVMGLGGYGAVYWWMSEHESVEKWETGLAFVIGAAPGFGLQYLLQWILGKRRRAQTDNAVTA